MRKIVLLSWALLLLLLCSCSSNQTTRNETRFDPSTTGSETRFDPSGEVFVAYDEPPLLFGSINPEYPEFARNHRMQGTVVLEVEVYKTGEIGNIRVKKSVTSLDQAAIDAVKRVRFKPGLSNGKAVNSLIIIPVEFRLN